MNSLIVAVALGTATITSYRSVPEQTDSTPFITSIGQHVSEAGAAVSPDFLNSGDICYGDAVIVDGHGIRYVNDTTHPRLKKTIDLWVKDYKSEKKVGITKRKIWVLKSSKRFCKKPLKKLK